MFTLADMPVGVFLRRTRNGWCIIRKESDTEVYETVHQDDDNDYEDTSSAQSLLDGLTTHFDSYFQSKWTGGIVASVQPSRATVEAEEDRAREAALAAQNAAPPEPEPEPAPEPEPEPEPVPKTRKTKAKKAR